MLYEFDGRQPEIGQDTYVSETAQVIGDVRIGDNCYIGHGAIIRGDYGSIEIDSGTAVEEGVIIHAPPEQLSRIGKKVTMGHGAIIHSAEIGDGVVIGMGAILSIGVKIGAGAIVAEGAIVKMNQIVPEDVVVAGNPCQIVRPTAPKDRDFWSWAKQLYIDLAARYLKVGMNRISQ